ncbi:methyltransferase domain-containing protein [candidate division KSB1 bacterium]|nr:methyltransferase domain-containing protein [candidate division KSB1 bacterium]
MAAHICPVWIGYLLASPLRKLIQNPKIVKPYLENGMTVVDFGSAMGYFSIPMAKMVGRSGKVICVDVQERMLKVLQKRAARAGVSDRIIPHLSTEEGIDLDDHKKKIDFILASAVLHETPDPDRTLQELSALLKPGATFMLIEPKGHVGEEEFERIKALAIKFGLHLSAQPHVARSRTALFIKEEMNRPESAV